MSARIAKGRREEHGAVLALVLMAIAILSVLGSAIASLARIDTQQQNAQETTSRSFLAAEAGVNRGIGEFRNVFLDSRLPSGDDFAARRFELGGLGVDYQLLELPGNPVTITLPAGDMFAGLFAQQYRYSVRARSYGAASDPQATLGAEFDVSRVPIFQFLAFYANDLAFATPPNMTLHGRIHTNGSIYLDAGAASTVRIEDLQPSVPIVQVTAAGDVIRGEGDPYNWCMATVVIDALKDADGDGSYDPLPMNCVGGAPHALTSEELAPWAGSVQAHVKNVTAPPVEAADRGSGLFWQRADLRIVLDLTAPLERLPGAPETAPLLHPIVVQTVYGTVDAAKTKAIMKFLEANPGKLFYNDVPNCPYRSPACSADVTKYTPAFASADLVYRRADDAQLDPKWAAGNGAYDNRRGGFFNNREKVGAAASVAGGKWIYLLDIDLQALLDWNRKAGAPLFDPDDTTDGGIVLFASVVGPLSDGINDYGVRIFDSPALGFPKVDDPTGITVVSDQALYVEGNYNVDAKAPAAFIADSLNVLSQGWETPVGTLANDEKSTMPYTARPASPTTINAALLAGVDVQTPGVPNGGFNNYPRFHEDWIASNTPLTLRGSMVTLGPPRHVDGPWCGSYVPCDIYTPPIRNWDYDPDFSDAKNLPPLTPSVVWVQQTLFAEDFR